MFEGREEEEKELKTVNGSAHAIMGRISISCECVQEAETKEKSAKFHFLCLLFNNFVNSA